MFTSYEVKIAISWNLCSQVQLFLLVSYWVEGKANQPANEGIGRASWSCHDIFLAHQEVRASTLNCRRVKPNGNMLLGYVASPIAFFLVLQCEDKMILRGFQWKIPIPSLQQNLRKNLRKRSEDFEFLVHKKHKDKLIAHLEHTRQGVGANVPLSETAKFAVGKLAYEKIYLWFCYTKLKHF